MPWRLGEEHFPEAERGGPPFGLGRMEAVRLRGGIGREPVVPQEWIQSSAAHAWRECEAAENPAKRRKAMEAFIQAGEAALDKAIKARPRQLRSFAQGGLVYVCRSPLPRKKGKEESDRAVARELRGPVCRTWSHGDDGGSQRVGVYERRTMEVCGGADTKCNQRGRLEEEFAELSASLNRAPSKRAYKDISQWDQPPEAAEEEE